MNTASASKPAIVVHGGAGEWRPERQQAGVKGVRTAAQLGFDVLKRCGSALDAVETAVMSMEDDEVFNAGLGSSLTFDKHVEMEASIMDGKTLMAGAAALVSNVKNPVRLARTVMEETDHIFIVGQSVEKLAENFGLKRENPFTERREHYWRELKSQLTEGKLNYYPKLSKLMKLHPKLFDFDTVGAVAVDKDGNVAAATSTGGIALKIPGRIGDTPLIGCGNYADNEAGACSATGIGEVAIKFVIAKSTCDLIRFDNSPQAAVENSIRQVNRRVRTDLNHMGLIAVDTEGNFGAAHNSPNMCWAYINSQMQVPQAFLKAKIVSNKLR